MDRIVRSALHQAEQTLTRRIVQAIPADVVERLHALVAMDGESNWLEGVQLLALYIILAAAFYVIPS